MSDVSFLLIISILVGFQHMVSGLAPGAFLIT